MTRSDKMATKSLYVTDNKRWEQNRSVTHANKIGIKSLFVTKSHENEDKVTE